METSDHATSIQQIERPSPRLMTYYVLSCLLGGPLFPFLLIPAYFRYHTMRYRFDAEGISMRWGILFRREIILNYSRIQDIHLSSNLVERWLGLAKLQIQTASGSSTPEMTIEGLHEFEAIRDFLYTRMRGGKEVTARPPAHPAIAETPAVDRDELTRTLQAVTAELRAVRLAIERHNQPPPQP